MNRYSDYDPYYPRQRRRNFENRGNQDFENRNSGPYRGENDIDWRRGGGEYWNDRPAPRDWHREHFQPREMDLPWEEEVRADHRGRPYGVYGNDYTDRRFGSNYPGSDRYMSNYGGGPGMLDYNSYDAWSHDYGFEQGAPGGRGYYGATDGFERDRFNDREHGIGAWRGRPHYNEFLRNQRYWQRGREDVEYRM